MKNQSVKNLQQEVKTLKKSVIIAVAFNLLKTSTGIKNDQVLKSVVRNFRDLNVSITEVNNTLSDLVTEKVLDGDNTDGYKSVDGKSTSAATIGTKLFNKPSEVKGNTISRTQAQHFMENNNGHFFTATFVTKKEKLRTLNGQYLKDSTAQLGYIKVRETGKMKKGEDGVRNVNLQTLEQLKIGGKTFNVG